MRWIPNLGRNIVPILFGISLTTVTCVSLAIFCKSLFEKDDNEKNTKKSTRIVTSKCIKIQCKVPKQFISAIIGRGGSVIKDIQAKTGTYIKISDENIESSDCLCIIQGKEIESIRLAESIIQNIIYNQPIIETFELFVPYEAWTKYMISNRGSVRNIQLTTGAKVIVESEPYNTKTGLKRKLILKGTDSQISHAMSYIDCVLPSIQDDEKISSKLKTNLESTEDSSSFSDSTVEDIVDTAGIEIVYIPCEVYKAIAGIEEDTMEQIRRSSGAKIILQENVNDLPSETIIISGTNDQRAAAANQIRQRSEEILKIRKYLEHEFAAETVLGSILFYGNNFKNIRDLQSASKVYKMLMSHKISEEIVERNGKIIQEWQNYSGAKITIENDPHKSEDGIRETTITGTNIQILTAIEQIAGKYPNEIQVPDVKHSIEIIDNRDIKIYDMSVPLVSCKRIEDCLQKIRQFSEAQIIMESDSQSYERKIIITGNIDQIAQAVLWIKDKVREEYQYQSELKNKVMDIEIKMPNSKRITDKANNTSNNVLKFPSSKDDLIEVIVSTSRTPNQFWIYRLNSENNASSQLLEEITEYYDKQENRELHVLKKILPGQMVAAKRCNDKWYRAKIISIVNSNKCEVLFVDSGHLEEISTNDLLELRTDMLCIRMQATECSLANVKPRESEWNFDACKKFDELVNVSRSKCLLAKIRNYKKCSDRFNYEVVIPCLDLYNKIDDEYVNVGDTLVSLEFAQYEEKLCSMTSSMLSCSE